MKRFDDVVRTVRLNAARVLVVLFDNLPEDYHPTKHLAYLQDLFKAAVIFLDDPDDKLQEAILSRSFYLWFTEWFHIFRVKSTGS